MRPLPSDAEDYKMMPKATCKSCMQEMPLQVLASHVENCSDDFICVSESEMVKLLLLLLDMTKIVVFLIIIDWSYFLLNALMVRH